MFKKKEKKNIYVRLVNTQGEIIREFNCTEKDLRKVKENDTEIRLVVDNSYEMVATDEQLEKLRVIKQYVFNIRCSN
ncbi:hypothetical protein DT426_10215 [Bacillus cereus]|uniref:Uncharacterized protein n=1 Tax=Bacillus thuringiensis HD-771 TaxID=1218175 RepID=A0A9W3J785_BACTU|nr:hypothetical protein BTG_09455 [Bacillus thuringiensis HD-771]AND07586.1 hypothetical protein Bt4C1_10390 [Bacillus thuringiensis serovar alesti]AZV66025.1 hypothetical protein DT426_10215 [Bacillus cereus]EJR05690.1 hypothetical protein II5_02899 [Bacillus cereus MSX-A1]MBV6679564.1 hypothetical protein [Bacillus thuringiensis]OUA96622.1 hypothetical protein BK706_03950 [Bacillus thuringiensis serovar leesis]OUB66266.1 hypothetical protein BK744_27580 [Bacillus thuringiensis serovar zhaod